MSITAPGVYEMTAEEYHADPVPDGSLSSTGLRDLLKAPAIFQHRRTNPEHKTVYDFGHVAHRLVLGAGSEFHVVHAKDFKTKAAQNERDKARADGLVPILVREYETAKEMAAAVQAHPLASKLFRHGKPEQALFWLQDGVWRRALVDWLPDPVEGRRMFMCDYKTTASANPKSLAKSVHNFGYHQQADWYLSGARALELAPNPAFLFVFQEKTAPYLVTVVELDEVALDWGRVLNERAVDIYRRCKETDRWPGYSEDVVLTRLPAYAERQYEYELEAS